MPPYTYAAVVLSRLSRYDLVFDVDVGFGLWRRAVTMRLAGKGATDQAAAAQPGQRMIIATERSYGRYIARVQPDDAKPAYQYKATLVEGHDADTLRANIDLGFEVWMRRTPVRLAGCNARELSEPGGLDAKQHMADAAPAGTAVLLCSMRNDKYGGRYNGSVIMPGGRSLAETLIASQWAAAWDGHGAKPVPPWPRTS